MSPLFVRTGVVRVTQKKFTVSVGAIVTNEAGEVLLLDHVLRPASGWGIPGGFINRDEQPETAIRRELCEEIGLNIEAVEILRVQTFDRHVEVLFRARARERGEVQSLEIKEIRWFDLSELPPEMNKTQQRLVREVLSKPPDK